MKTNEKLTLIQIYHDEVKTKLWRQYHVDQNNKKQGEEKWWCVNGKIYSICNYKNGVWHGKNQEWLDDGRWYIDTRHFKKGIHGTKIRFNYEQY